MFKLVLEKTEESEIKFANIRWIIKKAREFQKNIYFCFIDYGKAFDCVDHNKLGKLLKEIGIPDHLTCLLRNLYALMLGGIGGRKRRGWQRLDGITNSMDVSLSELRELVMDRKTWRATIHGVAKSQHDWATELNWTELMITSALKWQSWVAVRDWTVP